MLPRTIRRPLAACLLALALPALLAPAPGHAEPRPGSPVKPRKHASYSHGTVTATNDVRAAEGVAALDVDRCLRTFARKQAKAMAAAGRMAHQDLRPVLRRCDLDLAGENLASGYRSGERVVEAWLGPSHRANLLEPRFEAMAVVSRRSEDGVWYVAQVLGSRR
ncbi:CAP domain-containing protein [Nocardioides sp. SYSU DS0663]|uniref:CAP domain-containing protein n=1 Tax=Nocardioides sp. SYSU DS0663 TaxID=3416445 RepID=UPI003F4C8FD0